MKSSWDLFQLLELSNPEKGAVTCYGTTQKDRRCWNRPAAARQSSARYILSKLDCKLNTVDEVPATQDLHDVYDHLVCHWHGDQWTTHVRDWKRIIKAEQACRRLQPARLTVSMLPPTPPYTPQKDDPQSQPQPCKKSLFGEHQTAKKKVGENPSALPPVSRNLFPSKKEVEAPNGKGSIFGIACTEASAAFFAQSDAACLWANTDRVVKTEPEEKGLVSDERDTALVSKQAAQIKDLSTELASVKSQLEEKDKTHAAIAAEQAALTKSLSTEVADLKAQLQAKNAESERLVQSLQTTLEQVLQKLDRQGKRVEQQLKELAEKTAATAAASNWTHNEPRPPALIEGLFKFLTTPSKWGRKSWFSTGRA